ncbi:MAG: sugar phosphate isomerase/epimerase [Phycisphaerales bacterium]|nr:MAG: sugar phosphate isomerase/epimerase [Phycisphaerales bacterium]
MARIAFSTVACPDWTLDRVAQIALDAGYSGVELRSMGRGGTEFVCDPGLTAPGKVRRLTIHKGVEVAGVASGVHYDTPVFPPVIGHVFPHKFASIESTKEFVDIASEIGAPFVRVFPFGARAKRGCKALRRLVVGRLVLAADAARHSGVRLLLENGGAYPTAEEVASLVDEVGSPNLSVCYALAAAHEAGEDVAKGVRTLGGRLRMARVKDLRAGEPRPLGQGDQPCEDFVRAANAAASTQWIVFEWDKAWVPGLADASEALPEAARTLIGWMRAANGHASTDDARAAVAV